jgi:hypothetical protein
MYSNNFLQLVFITDSNCIEIWSPDNFAEAKQVGHIGLEYGLSYDSLTDDEYSAYGEGFIFTCDLAYECSSHRRTGYAIDIVVRTVNTKE